MFLVMMTVPDLKELTKGVFFGGSNLSIAIECELRHTQLVYASCSRISFCGFPNGRNHVFAKKK